MQNIKLVLAYDGTDYYGWQKTPTGPSIEATLQLVLEQILQHPIHLQAASRTDRGVHALGQVCNFTTTKHPLDLTKLDHSLNSLLPASIVVRSIEQSSPSFHPTLDVKGKIYHYTVSQGKIQLPHHRLYSWHVPFLLDQDKMKEAITLLVGIHNFKGLTNTKKNETYSDFDRQVENITIQSLENDRLCFKISGKNFLYKMVRNIVGTLVYIGCGKLSLEDLEEVLASGDRTLAGMTAPAHGLFLHEVIY